MPPYSIPWDTTPAEFFMACLEQYGSKHQQVTAPSGVSSRSGYKNSIVGRFWVEKGLNTPPSDRHHTPPTWRNSDGQFSSPKSLSSSGDTYNKVEVRRDHGSRERRVAVRASNHSGCSRTHDIDCPEGLQEPEVPQFSALHLNCVAVTVECKRCCRGIHKSLVHTHGGT